MKINSKFKDYYDHIEHITGGDPAVLYVRNRLKPLIDHGDVQLPQHIISNLKIARTLPNSYQSTYHNAVFKWLIIAGKYYLIYQFRPNMGVYTDWKLVAPGSEMMAALFGNSRNSQQHVTGFYFGTGDDYAIALSRELQQPVFTCTSGWEYTNKSHKNHKWVTTVDCDIPILQDLGFASVIPAEQMYQDIAYFMSNTIRTNADTSPPVEVSEKDKIVGHGFDLKQSFRHRK
jgi:hypothetical protein